MLNQAAVSRCQLLSQLDEQAADRIAPATATYRCGYYCTTTTTIAATSSTTTIIPPTAMTMMTTHLGGHGV